VISKSKRYPFEDPLFNRGTAFTEKERDAFGLQGQLPCHVSTIEEQVKRRYANFCEMENWVSKHHFLSALQNRNEVLFYRFLLEYVTEMVPFIYTPTVGDISRHYSMLYREQRGLYLSYPLKDRMEEMVANYPYNEIDVIVVTDGERILGLGDLGVGGMAISVGKLSLYSLFGGIHPARTLPVVLDVGTNNAGMLSDPLYLGYRSQRVTGAGYDEFVERFISAIEKRYPNVLLQWEDFAKAHAWSLLERYRERLCSFNDDIQGTASVVLSAIYSAVKLSKSRLKEQRFAVFGGGSAGLGICDQIVKALLAEGGISEGEARKLFYVVDIQGLLHTKLTNMDPNQRRFAQDHEKIGSWDVQNPHHVSLLDVVERVHPTILIGVSTQAGAFTEEIIREMARHVARPVIFPLSNPTSRSEAHPIDLMKWTKGQAIIATGSPFEAVAFEGRILPIAQCNNVYIFPGVGLGLIATEARKASDTIFIEAAKVLSHHSPLLQDPYGLLFPTLDTLRSVSREIGIAVAKVICKEGLARASFPEGIEQRIDEIIWYPDYPKN